MKSKTNETPSAYCKVPTTDDPIEQAELRKLANKLRMRAETLFDAARDADSQNVDNGGRGHARAFICGQATAYQRAAEIVEALYELPF